MKAFAIDKYKDELTKRDVPDPVAGPGEVVVAINAASVNPIDERLRQGPSRPSCPTTCR
jgi:NADPH:quinone reductase-like Zn-dependent oxidoreductase